MSTLLYITANPKGLAQSYSLQLGQAFIEAYQAAHPQDEIRQLDLYRQEENFLQLSDMEVLFAPDKAALAGHPVLAPVHQFMQADKYVFAFPMWNFGLPSILKAYVDKISVAGLTFRYTADGPQGLLHNKKALLLNATGGDYREAIQLDHCARYMQDILAFMGVTDVQSFTVHSTNIQGFDAAGLLAQKQEEVRLLAPRF